MAVSVAPHMDLAGAADVQALRGNVLVGQQTLPDEPLCQAGVEAAGDRVFVDAGGRGKGAYLQARRGAACRARASVSSFAVGAAYQG